MTASKYHISPATGRPNKCYAQEGNCPLGAEDGSTPKHYDSKEDARAGYESDNSHKTLATMTKKALPKEEAISGSSESVKLDEKSNKLFKDFKNIYTKKDQALLEKLSAGKPVKDAELDSFIENNRQNLILDSEDVKGDNVGDLYNAVVAIREARATPSTLVTPKNFDPSAQSIFSNKDARSRPHVAIASVVKELHNGDYMRERKSGYIDQLLDKESGHDQQYAGANKDYFDGEIKRSNARLKSMVKEIEWLKNNDPNFKKSLDPKHEAALKNIKLSTEDAPIGNVRKIK